MVGDIVAVEVGADLDVDVGIAGLGQAADNLHEVLIQSLAHFLACVNRDTLLGIDGHDRPASLELLVGLGGENCGRLKECEGCGKQEKVHSETYRRVRGRN